MWRKSARRDFLKGCCRAATQRSVTLTNASCPMWVKRRNTRCEQMTSAISPKDGVIGRPSLWIAEDFWVLRFRLMVKRGPLLRPQASEGEAQHGPFCWIGRIGQGNEHLHCG